MNKNLADACQIFDHRYLSTTAQVALIQMKEKEISAIAAKIEDEQSLGSKMQKQVTKLMIKWIGQSTGQEY